MTTIILQKSNGSNSNTEVLVLFIFSLALILFIFTVFFLSRFRKFSSTEYVIHYRRGRVIRSGIGGVVLKMPFLDNIVTLPMTIQNTPIELTYRRTKFELVVLWRVIEPVSAYSRSSWMKSESGFIDNNLADLSISTLRKLIGSKSYQDIKEEIESILEDLERKLGIETSEWGIKIESIEIKSIEKV